MTDLTISAGKQRQIMGGPDGQDVALTVSVARVLSVVFDLENARLTAVVVRGGYRDGVFYAVEPPTTVTADGEDWTAFAGKAPIPEETVAWNAEDAVRALLEARGVI